VDKAVAIIIDMKKWFWIHRWTSLICTLFLLLLCVTGLPLIFGEEIDHFLTPPPAYAVLPANTPMADLDAMIRVAQQRYPKDVVSYVYIDDDEPQVVVNLLPDFDAAPDQDHSLHFDARTGGLLKDAPPASQQPKTFIALMYSLHTDLFAGLPGELFLGLMGLLFVVAIVSGVVLYGPFMRKLKFGTVRGHRAQRLKWLDLHNLLGIATGAWLLVVGVTGVINELSTPLFGLWQMTDVKQLLQQYNGTEAAEQHHLKSLQEAYATARKAAPDMQITSVVFPGNTFGTPYHYLVWTKGSTPLTSRLFSPVLIDARDGHLSNVVKMPWYLRGLEVCRPLHFGDYGGLPLKILWLLFDLVAILVLISGIYLWFVRRKSQEAYFFSEPVKEKV
jgi:uncharacterized iron-regulated membrane protein